MILLRHSPRVMILLRHSPLVMILLRHSPRVMILLRHSPLVMILLSHSPLVMILLRHSPRVMNLLRHSPRVMILLRHSPLVLILLRHSPPVRNEISTADLLIDIQYSQNNHLKKMFHRKDPRFRSNSLQSKIMFFSINQQLLLDRKCDASNRFFWRLIKRSLCYIIFVCTESTLFLLGIINASCNKM